jgi:hypothetical protein
VTFTGLAKWLRRALVVLMRLMGFLGFLGHTAWGRGRLFALCLLFRGPGHPKQQTKP